MLGRGTIFIYYDYIKKLITIGFIDMFSLIQLKTFTLCAELGSFSAAARRLGKAQSVVSQAIANLEIDLNQPLFDRTSRTPKLTPVGEQLLSHAHAVLAQAHEMEQAAHCLSAGEESKITICVDNALLTQCFFQLISEFQESFNATELTVEVLESGQIAEQVSTRKANIGLMLLDPELSIGVEQGAIGKIEFITAVNPDHPLSKQQRASRGELSKYQQIALSSSNGFQAIPLISPKRLFCNDYRTMSQLAMDSLGWASLPLAVAEPLIKQGKLARIEVLMDTQTWEIAVDRITQLDATKGPALSWLMQQCESLYQ